MNMLMALAYPFRTWLCCMWLSFLAMIINLVDGSRWARFSWSTGEWWFRCLAIWAGVYLFFI